MMSKVPKKWLGVMMVMLAASLPFTTAAQNQKWRDIERRELVKFNWGCALPAAYPAARLNQIVRATMRRKQLEGFGTWGDRAFAFDLNMDQSPEYFVPLDCGGTGNCAWGIFSLRPARLLGLLNAQYIYVHQRRGLYPTLITYTHMSAAEGLLKTYAYSHRRYVWLGDKYDTSDGSVPGNEIPAFLRQARAACKNEGDG